MRGENSAPDVRGRGRLPLGACANGGRCSDSGPGVFQCRCVSGWTGRACDEGGGGPRAAAQRTDRTDQHGVSVDGRRLRPGFALDGGSRGPAATSTWSGRAPACADVDDCAEQPCGDRPGRRRPDTLCTCDPGWEGAMPLGCACPRSTRPSTVGWRRAAAVPGELRVRRGLVRGPRIRVRRRSGRRRAGVLARGAGQALKPRATTSMTRDGPCENGSTCFDAGPTFPVRAGMDIRPMQRRGQRLLDGTCARRVHRRRGARGGGARSGAAQGSAQGSAQGPAQPGYVCACDEGFEGVHCDRGALRRARRAEGRRLGR